MSGSKGQQQLAGYAMNNHDLHGLCESAQWDDDGCWTALWGDIYSRWARVGVSTDTAGQTVTCAICGVIEVQMHNDMVGIVRCNPTLHAAYYDQFDEPRSRLTASQRRLHTRATARGSNA